MMRTFLLTMATIFSALSLQSCQNKKSETSEPLPVVVQKVQIKHQDKLMDFAGQIDADIQVDLTFKQSGYVKSLLRVRDEEGRMRDVQEGDYVEKGAVLARIDANELRRTVDKARAQTNSEKASVGSSSSQLQKAIASQKLAAINLERAKALYSAKAMTKPDYDEAVTNFDTSVADTKTASETISVRAGELQAGSAGLALANISLSESAIAAPNNGTVVAKKIEPGSFVSAGTVGFTLAKTDHVKVSFGVPDSLLPSIHLGSQVTIKVLAYPGKNFVGKVSKIFPSASQDTRTFQIDVDVLNTDRRLKLGMIARTQFNSGTSDSSCEVPLVALRSTQSGSDGFNIYCAVKEGATDIAKLKHIRVGDFAGNSVVVKSGLNDRDRIILNPSNALCDGMVINVINERTNPI